MKKSKKLWAAMFMVSLFLITQCKEKPESTESEINLEEPAAAQEQSVKDATKVEQNTRYVNEKNGVSMYKEPHADSEVMATIGFAEPVKIDSSFFSRSDTVNNQDGEWFKVNYKNRAGYVFNVHRKDRNFSHGNGSLAMVSPEAKISFAADCTTRENYTLQSDTYHSSLVLLKDGSLYEISSNSGDGENLIDTGSYTVSNNVYTLKKKEKTEKMYKVGKMLVDERAKQLIDETPDIFEQWQKNPLSADADESKLISVFVCE